jgi:hypothetical protein
MQVVRIDRNLTDVISLDPMKNNLVGSMTLLCKRRPADEQNPDY